MTGRWSRPWTSEATIPRTKWRGSPTSLRIVAVRRDAVDHQRTAFNLAGRGRRACRGPQDRATVEPACRRNPPAEKRVLAGLLRVPTNAVDDGRYRIPPDSSWRHATLDRASGDERRPELAGWIV